jgi:uncharacterized protein with HEPN domain
MARSWQLYAQDIVDCCEQLMRIRAQLASLDEFRSSQLHILAAERCLEIIGEAAKNIPPDIREVHNAVPWKNIIGMRDILAHGYFSISPAIIWDTIKNDVGILKQTVGTMLASAGEKEQ